MKLGEVIRKYRKAKELTQEEMATYLGVTAPAVNKWENGNAMPDIMLLAPIARLLDVSLNELLSFREELTTQEVVELTGQADKKFETESYESVFEWVKKQIEIYPNCESLIYNLAVLLDSNRLVCEMPENGKYDSFILNCYERLLHSSDEVMRTVAADSLYRYYLRQEQYEKAGEYLSFFSMQNPERKRKQAVLYEKAGNVDKAYQEYEEIIFSIYQILFSVLNSLFTMQLHEKNMEQARYYTEKKKDFARLFEMGEYSVYAADLELAQAEKDPDKTIVYIRGLLNNLDTVYAFSEAALFSHMTFKKVDTEFIEKLRINTLNGFRTDEGFKYMEGDPRWNELIAK